MNLATLGGIDGQVSSGINRLRSQPRTFVGPLEERQSAYEGNILRLKRGTVTFRSQTHEGVSAVREAADRLRSAAAVGELRFCKGLNDAAHDIVEFLGPDGDRKPTGDQMEAMIERHGQYEGTLSQVIAFIYEDDVMATLLDLIVCDGDKSRHTAELLRNGDYRYAGVAVSRPSKGPRLLVLQFVTDEWTDK